MKTIHAKKSVVGALMLVVGMLALPGQTQAEETLQQNLDNRDRVEITDANATLPKTLVQATGRASHEDRYNPDVLLDRGFHIRTGAPITMPTNIRMANLNTSHIIGAHGKGTVVRYTGRWEADGGNAFPRMTLTDGGHFIFTDKSTMNLVMDGPFFTRQLWVYGDGTGVLELEEGFVADATKNEPVADAMGTIRLGGVTLITHHTRNMPMNTRSDGRGGIYQNGHIVFENVPGNRWIVDTNKQEYSAQLDFDTDATVETRAHLTHNGHRRIVLPVGPGGHFTSTGAFRTTSPNVTITKTGPAMLALEGEQSYHPGSRMIVEEGLLRMATDPGLGRDPESRDRETGVLQAGVFLQVELRGDSRFHMSSPVVRLQKLDAQGQTHVWLDPGCELVTTEGTTIAEGATFDLFGAVKGDLDVKGTLVIDPGRGRGAAAERLVHAGALQVAYGQNAPDDPTLAVAGTATLSGTLAVRFWDRKGRVPETVVVLEAGTLEIKGEGILGTHTTDGGRFTYTAVQDGNRLLLKDIKAVEQDG